MFPVPRSSPLSPYSLPWTFKLFSIAIPCPLTRLIFSFLMHFFPPPNDLWAARFVATSNQKVITPWSVFLFSFFFFRKISFFVSVLEAWRWWIGESRAELFSRTKRRDILLYRRPCSDFDVRLFAISPFSLLPRVAKVWSSWFEHIFFLSPVRIGKSAAFPNVSRTRKRDWKTNNFSIPKDHLPAEDVKPARNMARQVVSA